MANSLFEYSLVIPCFNEGEGLPALVDRLDDAFSGKGVEVILVDNGSTDDTAKVIRRAVSGFDFIHGVTLKDNQGYGGGIIAGLKQSSGQVIGWTHADLQTDPADFLTAISVLKKTPTGENVFIKGKRKGRPVVDRFFSLGMSIFETLLLRTILIEINAQPTVFSRSFFMSWETPPTDFSLDLFAYYKAKKNGLSVRRFDVQFPDRQFGASKWNFGLHSKIRFIRRTIIYSLDLKRKQKG